MGQAEIHTEPDALANDLSLAPMDERNVYLKRRPLDAGLGGHVRQPLKRLDEYRTAIRIPGIVHGVDPDEDIGRADDLRIAQGQGKEDRISRRDLGDRDAGRFFVHTF